MLQGQGYVKTSLFILESCKVLIQSLTDMVFMKLYRTKQNNYTRTCVLCQWKHYNGFPLLYSTIITWSVDENEYPRQGGK